MRICKKIVSNFDSQVNTYNSPRWEQTYRPNIPLAPKTATLRPASDPLPPGPVSFSLLSRIRGTTGVLVARDLVMVFETEDTVRALVASILLLDCML